jgi:hypothetical protein
MTSSGFDFNVHNYSNDELEDLLGLQKNYTVNDIMSNKQKMCIQLASASSSIQLQSQMSEFLDAASKCLISAVAKETTKKEKGHDKYFDSIHNFPTNTVIPGSAADGHFVIADAYRMTQLEDYSNISGLKIGEYGAPPGKINPVKYSTIVSSINIDSRFRPNYFNSRSTDLHITLPERINNIVSYRVGSIEIPFYAIYSVSELSGNNAIQIVWGTTATAYTDTFTIVIPDGNYFTTADSTNVIASASIEKTINTILESNTVSSGGGGGLSGKLNFHIDQISGKSVFSQPAGATPSIYFKIITNVRSNGTLNYDAPLLSFLGWSLGFRNAEYISNNNGTVNLGAVVSEALAAFKAASYIFIAIDDYNNSVNDYYSAVFSDSFALKNVITRVNVGLLREISEASSTQLNRQRNFFGPVNIQKLHITLHDNFGRIIDLNNMDWNMELIFECVYN